MERKGRKNELADPQLPAIRSIADGRAMHGVSGPRAGETGEAG